MPKTTTEPKPTAAEPRPNSKTAAVIELLRRPLGASLSDLTEATGWQPHTTRAALSGLKKKGYAVEREKVNGVSRYRIAGACGR
jgi:DNA-binding IclR family transcriptional regulator